MGRPIEDFRIETSPILTDVPIALQQLEVAANRTAGVSQQATDSGDGTSMDRIEMTLHLAPERIGVRSVDSFAIDGRHSISVEITPGCARSSVRRRCC